MRLYSITVPGTWTFPAGTVAARDRSEDTDGIHLETDGCKQGGTREAEFGPDTRRASALTKSGGTDFATRQWCGRVMSCDVNQSAIVGIDDLRSERGVNTP